MRKILLLLSVIFTMSFVVQAKTIDYAQTPDGKVVTRLTFDRELVTIFYADGSQETVEETTIFHISKSSGIVDVNVDEQEITPQKGDGFYDLQGRRVNGHDLTPGIYIKRVGAKSIKVVKQ